MQKSVKDVATKFVDFLEKSPSPFHAVASVCELLVASGFQELKEGDNWTIEPLKKYFVTRNKSTVYAFSVGGKFVPGNGFSIVVGHTDSPCLKLKVNSKCSGSNFLQVGVETYGGGVWRTWFDRDLTVAGRVIVKNQGGRLSEKLVHIKRPILHVPNLAIHLDRDANEKFTFNKQDQLKPILATQTAAELNKVADKADCSQPVANAKGGHHTALLKTISEELKVEPEQVVDLELCLVDFEPPRITGLFEEFISSARLDNLVGSYTAIKGLIDSGALENDPNIRMAICFDNEECGSNSAQGARSSLTEWILRRLSSDQSNLSAFEQSIAKSFLISADQVHAVHPNYASKYEPDNCPEFHKGVVFKMNANQSYTTTSVTSAILKEIAQLAGVPLQVYMNRNDVLGGSTVGPHLAALLGIRTVDVGTPMLAMHSIRELACVSGVAQAIQLYTKFFETWPAVYQSFDNL